MFKILKRLKNSRHSLSYHYRSLICRFCLPVFQRMGMNITINHYYSPIPDLRYTENLYNQYFAKEMSDSCLNFNLIDYQQLLDYILKYIDEFNASELAEIFDNSSFGPVDAEILYSMIRKNRPQKIIEIGGGVSTSIITSAIERNKLEKSNCEYICIEPFPTKLLIDIISGHGELIKKKVENVDISLFKDLGENDILFIDSSHVVKPFNDVYFEFFRILPNLNRGVFVHFHDIYLPVEYPLVNLKKLNYFWNEQYMLHSFLLYNDYFKIEWAGSFAHINISESLEKHFKSYNRMESWPGSFWIKKIQ